MGKTAGADSKLLDEEARLAALQRYRIVDTPREERFDKITALSPFWAEVTETSYCSAMLGTSGAPRLLTTAVTVVSSASVVSRARSRRTARASWSGRVRRTRS
jgi:hypothetical protein